MRHASASNAVGGVCAVLSTVPTVALSQALQQCSYSALPWGQCGGSSACPDFLNATCTDQAWATVCCPPAGTYQQACPGASWLGSKTLTPEAAVW